MSKIISTDLSKTAQELADTEETLRISRMAGFGEAFLLAGLDYPIANPRRLLEHSVPLARKHFLAAVTTGLVSA